MRSKGLNDRQMICGDKGRSTTNNYSIQIFVDSQQGLLSVILPENFFFLI